MRFINKTQLVLVIALLLVTTIITPGTSSALQGKDFMAGNIIDDAIFFNSSSMSPAQIQNFLDSKVTTCRSGYTCLKDYVQDTQNKAAETQLCNQYQGGRKRASQIIHDVAKACGINPQVLLVVLQKEQSLITDTWPEDIQYRSATGFGCPDTAPCDSDYYGFFNQVYHGARIYKKYARDAAQYNYRSGRNNNILFNPSAACGSSTVYIQNQATAGLYIYTPYQPNQAALNNLYGTGDGCSAYGNRNFWRMFNDWFGSTRGSLIRTVTSSDLYYSDGQRRFIIPSMELAAQFGLGSGDVRFVSQEELNSVPIAAAPFSNQLGSVVKSNDDGDADGGSLYLVNDRSRIPFSSMDQFANYGFSTSSITYLPLATIQRLSLSSSSLSDYIQAPDRSISKIESGKKRAIFELHKLSELNPSGKVSSLTNFTLSIFPDSTPLVDGDYVIFGPDSGVRVQNGTSYLTLPAMDIYDCWKLDTVKRFSVASYSISNGINAGSLKCTAKDSTNNTFLIDDGVRYHITETPGLQPSITSSTLMNRLPIQSFKPVLKGAGPELSVHESGVNRPLLSIDTFIGLGYTSADIQTFKNSGYNVLPKGARKMLPGSVLVEPNGALSVISSQNTRLQITSTQQFSHYGYDYGKLARATPAELEAYTSTGNLSHYIKVGSDMYLIDGKVRYFIPNSIDSNLAIDRNSFTSYTPSIITNSTLSWTMTPFIKADNDAAVYKLVNGVKRPLASWETFKRESGDRPQDLVILKPEAVNRFTTGQLIF